MECLDTITTNDLEKYSIEELQQLLSYAYSKISSIMDIHSIKRLRILVVIRNIVMVLAIKAAGSRYAAPAPTPPWVV